MVMFADGEFESVAGVEVVVGAFDVEEVGEFGEEELAVRTFLTIGAWALAVLFCSRFRRTASFANSCRCYDEFFRNFQSEALKFFPYCFADELGPITVVEANNRIVDHGNELFTHRDRD